MYSLISTQGTGTYTRWDVRGGWNGWNGWNTLDGNYYSLYFSTNDKIGKLIRVYLQSILY
jgi:hypothetical protein